MCYNYYKDHANWGYANSGPGSPVKLSLAQTWKYIVITNNYELSDRMKP